MTGRKVLEAYIDWMKHNSPERWHRKKKYNYGNVLDMPEADYLETHISARPEKKPGICRKMQNTREKSVSQ